MNKKNTAPILLIPGTTGWDLWSCTDGNSKLEKRTEVQRALEIDSLPATKALNMAFPVRELTSLAVWAPEGNEEDTQDLIDLHIEKTGLKQPAELGNLSQHEKLTPIHNGKQLYSVDVLKAPSEGNLPAASPQSFTTSVKCFHFSASAVTLWQEFGKWVLAITNENQEVVYYQGLTSNRLDSSTPQEIQFIITQLHLQQILTQSLAEYIIWSEDAQITPDGFSDLQESLSLPLSLQQKPSPVLPLGGKLLPADTRAERIAIKKKKQLTLLGAVASLCILGVIGFSVFKLIKVQRDAKELQAKADKLVTDNQHIQVFADKRLELEPLMDSDRSPMKLLIESTGIIPSDDLRIIRAEFKHIPAEDGKNAHLSITINGETPDSKLALDFDERLQNHQPFQDLPLQWNNPAPSKNQNGWKFLYYAEQL